MSPPTLSVIIPTLNEAEQLPALLTDLEHQKGIALEVVVGDGGSTDGTQQIADARGVNLVEAPCGRSTQMNAAAGKSTGEYLLFLHADSRINDPQLLSNAVASIGEKIARAGQSNIAGHFRLHFTRTINRHAMAYRYVEEKTGLNRVNTTNGDQGFLMTRDYFIKLGRFDEDLPFLEDQQLAEKIRNQGVWITLPGTLKTSARRFEKEGFHRRYILMSIIMGLYSTGVHSFFKRAPHVYRTQQETGKLLLTPFFRIIRQIMREELGFRGSLRAWFHVGRYVRQNSWQMFYFFDIWSRPMLGPDRYPMLYFHDRVFGPLTNFKIFDGITAILCFIWIMGVLTPYFRLREHGEMVC